MGDKSAFVGGMKLKISELGKVITGNTPSKKIKEFWDKDDVGFVKPDIISDEHIVKIKSEDCNEFISNAAISKARIVPKNSIFVTCIGNIGKIGVATENLAFNQQINAIIPNENVNLDYLCYAIFANKTRLQDIANAPIVPLLNKSQFSEFELEFDMDINTQTRIVHELNTVSNIILKYKQELLLLDELVRARFVEMFGDNKYEELAVEKVCTSIVDCPHTTPKYNGDLRNPAIRTSEIKKGFITWDTMKYVSDEEYIERTARLKPQQGDIVYGREGTFGNAAILPKGYKFCLGQRVMLLRPNNEFCISQYLLRALISDEVYNQALAKNNASTVAHVNVKDVKNFMIPVPPLELQNQFASFVEEIDKSRSRIQKSLKASQELFDSLMQEYFG